MPYARKDLLTWQKGMYYHIYNRGVSQSALFREPDNYRFVASLPPPDLPIGANLSIFAPNFGGLEALPQFMEAPLGLKSASP